jgi:hypothetical protein
MSKPLIIVPAFNLDQVASDLLVDSLAAQTNQSFRAVFAVDNCGKSAGSLKTSLTRLSPDFEYKLKISERRRYALANIVYTLYATIYADTTWVGILDGDDYLAKACVIDRVSQEYGKGARVAWSQFYWDGEISSLSAELPKHANPYSHPWVSSHFKTFCYKLFFEVPVANYMGPDGKFFRRCYDHALMMPLLWQCQVNNYFTSYIPEPLYFYNNKKSSIPYSEHSGGSREAKLAAFIRSRGFVF